MKRYFVFVVVSIGIVLIVGGFIYDVMFAGIPYQDPAPEISARYAHHSHIASTIRTVGAEVFLAGAVAGVAQFVARRFSQKQHS
jgi:hypothetical protein